MGRGRTIALAAFLVHAAVTWASAAQGDVSSPPSWWPWPECHRDSTNTWLDAFNFLDLIPGPPFLLVFVVYGAIAILGCRLLQGVVLSWVEKVPPRVSRDRLPLDQKLSHLAVAYLRGGRAAVVEAAVCNLYRMGKIDWRLRLTHAGESIANPSLSPVESAVFNACGEVAEPHRIAQDTDVKAALEDFEARVKPALVQNGLLPSVISWQAYAAFAALALLLVEGMGYVRIQRSLLRGYTNVGFLILLMVVAGIAALFALYRRRSRLGDRFLARVRDDYKPVLRQLQTKVMRPHAPEALYALAAFGAGALSGTSYALIRDLMKPPYASASCGGCGGGGCGGGGCGGGGCGGGGCGGG